jgi:rhamnosyltransferase subunit B
MQRHFVLATYGSHGDVHPFVGLGRVLASRGHRVTLHTSTYFESLGRSAGLEFCGFGTAEDFLREITNPLLWHPRRGYEHVFGKTVREGLRKSYDALRPLVSRNTVVVGSSLALSARVLHDEVGCPGATVHLSPVVIRSSVAPGKMNGLFMPTWMPVWVKRKIWETGDRLFVDPLICPTLNRLRSELGLPPVQRPLNGWWNHPDLVLGLWPDWYGPAASDWPGQTRLVGFPLYDEAEVTPISPELDRFLTSGTPPIAFTPGSAMKFGESFFRHAADACVAVGRRGLLLTRHAEQIPAQLPDGVIHVPYAPFSTLLPRCCAIVHHGGIGTTAQALRAGVPQVITHYSHDQPDNAHRLEKLGVGRGIPARKVTPARLARSLTALLDSPSVLQACRTVATRVDSKGLDRACDLLETLQPSGISP